MADFRNRLGWLWCSFVLVLTLCEVVTADKTTIHSGSKKATEETEDDNDLFDMAVDEDDIYETEVRDLRIYETDETCGFAETIEVEKHRKGLVGLPELLSKSVGIQVRSMGGLGSYSTASIRGSTPNQVPVYLDGMQLNIGGFSVVNLGDFSLDIMDRIEVYRGSVPLYLGASGIGGGIFLKTLEFDEPKIGFAASYGSWNTWRLLSLYAGKVGETKLLTVVSGNHSDGDFRYYNRKGTTLMGDTEDDTFVHRTNNAHNSISALGKISRRIGVYDVRLMDTLFYKTQELSGIDHMVGQSNASIETMRNGITLLGQFENKTSMLSAELGHLMMMEAFRDLFGEIGIGHQDHRYRTHGVFGTLVGRHEVLDNQSLTLRLSGKYERYLEHRIGLPDEEQQSPVERAVFEFGVEHDWNIVPGVHIVPVLRGEFQHDHFGGGQVPSLLKDFPETTKNNIYFFPAVGVKYEPIEHVVFRMNLGRYHREPDITELFGDRGAVVGNPELNAETGYNADAGVTYQYSAAKWIHLIKVSGSGFLRRAVDLIAMEQNSQSTSQSVNIDAARIFGAELSLALGVFDMFTISGNYTYFNGENSSTTKNYRGKKLPGRPEHELYGRFDVEKTLTKIGLAAWFDADYSSMAFVTRYNRPDLLTSHFFLGSGLRISLLKIGLSCSFEIKNITNRLVFKNEEGDWMPMSDFDRYPLPGRTFMGTLHWMRPNKKK